MGKIGILTFHSANNYGAFLQTKSLFDFLRANGADECKVLNYRPSYIEEEYQAFPRRKSGIKARLIQGLRWKDIRKRNQQFEYYRRRYLDETRVCKNAKELIEECNQCSKIVVGSDQIWNFDITSSDYMYLLDGVSEHIKRYSYAASTGGCHLFQTEQEHGKLLLKKFRKISVREEETRKALLDEIEGCKAVTVLDPVFLTSKEAWDQFADHPNREPYLLFFQMGISPKAEPALKFAEELGARTGYPVLYISDQERWYKFRTIRHVGVINPAQFLGYIADAACVITNSFHAAAFSILFHTPFYVETCIARSDRITYLLNQCELEKQGLWKGKPKEGSVSIPQIDWDCAERFLAEKRQESIRFLQEIISDE